MIFIVADDYMGFQLMATVLLYRIYISPGYVRASVVVLTINIMPTKSPERAVRDMFRVMLRCAIYEKFFLACPCGFVASPHAEAVLLLAGFALYIYIY